MLVRVGNALFGPRQYESYRLGETMQAENSATAISSAPINFEFTGKAGEYFSIWIVNILLTILTLGVYSAWAKVRNNQYFYGNTWLDGSSFRYLADPKQILKGRVIAVVLFALYYFSGLISPVAAGISLLLIMLLIPALLVMSMSFQLRNSAYKNIKFSFEKNFKKAYLVFILPILVMGPYFLAITVIQPEQLAIQQEIPKHLLVMIAGFPLLIMLLFPWWEYMITQFKVDHADFGTSDFAFTANKRAYYFLYLRAFLGILAVGILFAAVFAGGVAGAISAMSEDGAQPAASPILSVALSLVFVIPYLWFFAYVQTKKTNLVYSNINIEGHRLTSNLSVGYMMYLYATNTLAMALSLGLLMPWAKIRTARYRARMTAVVPASDFNSFVATQSRQQSALGEEVGEVFDLGLGM